MVPTIRVLVTFTKFEELEPIDEFATPPTSPAAVQESPRIAATQPSTSSSWFGWMKAPYNRSSSFNGCSSSRIENTQDPFEIPRDYKWITAEEKRKKMQEKNKSKKVKKNQQQQQQRNVTAGEQE